MKRKKRAITLMEIMIVILLIGLISSVVGYNMKGSLDKGKAFKSKQGAEKIRETLLFESIDKGVALNNFVTTSTASQEYVDYLLQSGLFKNKKDCLDGWNQPYTVTVKDDELYVESAKLKDYEKTHKVKVETKPAKEASVAE